MADSVITYEHHEWNDGEVITKAKMNNLEWGVKEALQKDTPGINAQPAEADLAESADLAAVVTKINAILAKLRAAGIISAS